MTSSVPPAPEFGAPAPVRGSAETLALLSARRSSSSQTLTGPGLDAGQLADLLRLATRTPDHGKLFPWRLVVLEGEAKARFVAGLKGMTHRQDQPGKAEAVLAKIANPPLTVAVISSPKEATIPLWEQELSAGAVCMNLLIAAEAMGFGASWITDWYAFDHEALALLGVRANEKVAGYVHIGTPTEHPLERVRPEPGAVIERWNG
jgi:nitroreductase